MNRRKTLLSAGLCAAAGFWAVYCLCMPLYNVLHWCILIAGSFAAGLITAKLTAKRLPPDPVSTGSAALDALLANGAASAADMRRFSDGIGAPSLRETGYTLASLTEQIFDHLRRDPTDEAAVRRFAGYFLPTARKLLRTCAEMDSAPGENAAETRRRIGEALTAMVPAWQKQLDALFANEALDIETDIAVLETMLKREGLSDSDLAADNKGE